MAKIKIHAGDFPKGNASLIMGRITFSAFSMDGINLNEIDEIDIASEESVKKVGGTVGWGATGALILGPVGLLAGLLLGGRKTEITFVARFIDGRKMLGSTDSDTYKKLAAAVF